MRIKNATAIYTGGGIYIYGGQLQDGKYFYTADEWLDCEVIILDADSLLEEYIDYCGQEEWQAAHTIESLFDDEAKKFSLKMLKWITKYQPDGNYQTYDLETRLKEMKGE